MVGQSWRALRLDVEITDKGERAMQRERELLNGCDSEPVR